MFQIQNTYSQSRSNFLAQPQLSLCLLIKPQLHSNSSLSPCKLAMRAPFFQLTFQHVYSSFVFSLICRSFWLTPVPVVPLLLSSSLLFFIELCKYVMIEVAENIYYYYYRGFSIRNTPIFCRDMWKCPSQRGVRLMGVRLKRFHCMLKICLVFLEF